MFRVSPVGICRIYRMGTEQTYTTVGEPDSSVILKYIRNIASEAEKSRVALWIEEDPEHEKIVLQVARIYYAVRAHERIASRDWLRGYRKVIKRINKKKKNRWLYWLSFIRPTGS